MLRGLGIGTGNAEMWEKGRRAWRMFARGMNVGTVGYTGTVGCFSFRPLVTRLEVFSNQCSSIVQPVLPSGGGFIPFLHFPRPLAGGPGRYYAPRARTKHGLLITATSNYDRGWRKKKKGREEGEIRKEKKITRAIPIPCLRLSPSAS